MRWKRVLTMALCGILAAGAVTVGMSNVSDTRAEAYYEDIEKFPESYKEALYKLKEAHPNWTFEVMNTGLDWNTVVYNEMTPASRSLVPSYFDSSFAGEYYGDGWSCATQAAVEYYLDPRNWLTEDYIFQFEKLTYNANTQGIATVQKVLANTFMSGYIEGYEYMGLTYAQAFRDIGASIGVSPVHLATRVYQEQGAAGSSDLISGTYPGYEGYYNYYNIQATGKEHDEIVRNGLNEAKSEGWNNRYVALLGGSKKVGERYILRGQDTLYLQKFDVDGTYDGRYWHQYMQNLAAPSNEGRNIKRAYEKAGMLGEAFVFKIPVYNNMPGFFRDADVEEGTYRVVSAIASSIVFDVDGSSEKNGANLRIWNDEGAPGQRFIVSRHGESFTITAVHSKKALDVEEWGIVSGTNVQQWDANGGKAQDWKFYDAGNGYVYIASAWNDLFLTVDGQSAGANINLQNFTGNDNQKFMLKKYELPKEIAVSENTYRVLSAIDTSLTLNIADGSKADGANLDVQYSSGLLSQIFAVRKNGTGYVVEAIHSGKVLDVEEWGITSKTNVQQWESNGGVAQDWKFYDAGNGYVYIASVWNSLFLTVDGKANGTNVNLQYFTGEANQKFKLEIYEAPKEISVSDGSYNVLSAIDGSLVLNIYGGSAANGANLDAENSTGSWCQAFNVKSNDMGYTISAANSGKCFDVEDWATLPGTNVQQWEPNGGAAQNWKFYDAGNGYVYIASVWNGLFLTVDGQSSGANVNLQYFAGNLNQKFKLSEVNIEMPKEISVNEGTYTVFSAMDTTLALNISDGRYDNGANLDVQYNNGQLCQSFTVNQYGLGYMVTAIHSGKALDVEEWGTVTGTNVQQWESNGGAAQNWKFYDAGNGYVYIVSAWNGLYLTVDGQGAGANVNMQNFTGGNNQKFKLSSESVEAPREISVSEGIYTLSSAENESLVLNIAGNSSENGANLDIQQNSGSLCQKFNIVKYESGYMIEAVHSGKVLDVEEWSMLPGTNIQQWDSNGGAAQNWRFYDAGNGYVYIASVWNNLYLTVDGQDNGANVNVQSFTGNNNQRFKLNK